MENLLEETLTVKEMINQLRYPHRDPKAPSLIQVQHQLMNGQRENLVGRNLIPGYFVSDTREHAQNPIVQLCKRWGKLREADHECDMALIVDRAEVAVLDTGASKTVVGKENLS